MNYVFLYIYKTIKLCISFLVTDYKENIFNLIFKLTFKLNQKIKHYANIFICSVVVTVDLLISNRDCVVRLEQVEVTKFQIKLMFL